jgi:hypothetical protein
MRETRFQIHNSTLRRITENISKLDQIFQRLQGEPKNRTLHFLVKIFHKSPINVFKGFRCVQSHENTPYR